MSSTKISAMSNASSIDGTELVPIVKDGINVKATISEIRGTPTEPSPSGVTHPMLVGTFIGASRAPLSGYQGYQSWNVLEVESSTLGIVDPYEGSFTCGINALLRIRLTAKLSVFSGAGAYPFGLPLNLSAGTDLYGGELVLPGSESFRRAFTGDAAAGDLSFCQWSDEYLVRVYSGTEIYPSITWSSIDLAEAAPGTVSGDVLMTVEFIKDIPEQS